MEFELGLKITKNLDDIHSIDFWMAKNRGGPLFLSRETETKFILTAHVRGYRRENIRIDINEDATLITISGQKPVQEMEMKGWMMHKKEPEVRVFSKVFQIPREVILDEIKAKYNEAEFSLTIYMPKLNKGIVGGGIEEVKNEHVGEGSSQDKQGDEDVDEFHQMTRPDSEGEEQTNKVFYKSRREDGEVSEKVTPPSNELKRGDDQEASTSQETKGTEDVGSLKHGDNVEEVHEEKSEVSCQPQEEETCEGEERDQGDEGHKTTDEQNDKSNEKLSKFFSPCFFMGGALLASLVVLICSLVRSKKQRV